MVEHTVILSLWRKKQADLSKFQAKQGYIVSPDFKKKKWSLKYSLLVEHLISVHEAQGSLPISTQLRKILGTVIPGVYARNKAVKISEPHGEDSKACFL